MRDHRVKKIERHELEGLVGFVRQAIKRQLCYDNHVPRYASEDGF
jgi:hypothetical protein